MTAHIVTAKLARQCQREYDAGHGTMEQIAARHGISVGALRRERKRLGLPRCPRGPEPGRSNYGGGTAKFSADEDSIAQWNAQIKPGWLVHGVVVLP